VHINRRKDPELEGGCDTATVEERMNRSNRLARHLLSGLTVLSAVLQTCVTSTENPIFKLRLEKQAATRYCTGLLQAQEQPLNNSSILEAKLAFEASARDSSRPDCHCDHTPQHQQRKIKTKFLFSSRTQNIEVF
jgi:hypothetical protein